MSKTSISDFKTNVTVIGILLTFLTISPIKAEDNKWSFEGIAITEAQWNPATHAAWMNELWLHGTWHPFRHSFFEVATVHTYGVRQNGVVDDLQGFSNISVDNMALGLDILGYGFETTFGADSSQTLTIRTGVRNMNEDYFITGNTTLFLNSSDGVFPTLGANYPLANLPLSGICLAHIDYKHKNGLGGQVSVYNGIAGETLDGTVFRLRPRRDGITTIAEMTFNNEPTYSFYNLGMTLSNFPEHDKAPKTAKAAWWLLVDQNILKGEASHLNLLLQGSRATFKDAACRDFAGAGLIFTKEENEEKTFQWTNIGAMTHYSKFAEATEWSQEIVANFSIKKQLSLCPSFQLIEKGADVYTVAIVRLTYTLE